MSDFPNDLLYTKEHEWTRLDGNKALVGITSFAIEQLGDVTQVDVPAVGDELKKDDVFGTVESVKAVSDLFAPLSGKVTKVNAELADSPELVNEDPYGKAWILEIELSAPAEKDELLSPDQYAALVAEES